MDSAKLQELCELGQQQLMRMEYIRAEKTLVQAETIADQLKDFDTLSRLYMPLQEARRQRRQRCGEGVVRLDLIGGDPEQIIRDFPHGQLLVAGEGSIGPALKVRQLQFERELYAETFLAVARQTDGRREIVIVPLEDEQIPSHGIVISQSELPRGNRKGTSQTFAEVMAMWERLHAPFLAAADAQPDLVHRIEGYRRTIRVDYACELAHQKLSDAAKKIARTKP